jgi:hypothetical protein
MEFIAHERLRLFIYEAIIHTIYSGKEPYFHKNYYYLPFFLSSLFVVISLNLTTEKITVMPTWTNQFWFAEREHNPKPASDVSAYN